MEKLNTQRRLIATYTKGLQKYRIYQLANGTLLVDKRGKETGAFETSLSLAFILEDRLLREGYKAKRNTRRVA